MLGFLAMQVPPLPPREEPILIFAKCQCIDDCVVFLNIYAVFAAVFSGPPLQKLIATKLLARQYEFPLETDSRRSAGASSQNGLGHGKKYLGAIRTAET